MEGWQIVVTTCAGLVTLLTFLEKIGITSKFRKTNANLNEINTMLANINELAALQQTFLALQKDQSNALLALLRSELYQCFKINREIEVWTDDELFVQTKLHLAYQALHGNGEEEIWWEKKKKWRVVSNEEYQEIFAKHYNC